MSENFAVVEYENAIVEFNGDKDEAILERMVSNPIHVYNVIRDMEYFVLEILPHIEYSILNDLCSDEFPIDYIPVVSGEFKEWTCQDFAGKGTRSSKMSYCDKSWKELNQDWIKSTGLISESCKLSCGSCKKNTELIAILREEMKPDIEWPTSLDLAGSAFSLFTIQYTFKLRVVDVMRGKLGKRQTFARLRIKDIERIVELRLEDETTITHFPGKDFAIAIEWIEGAISLLKQDMEKEKCVTETRKKTKQIQQLNDDLDTLKSLHDKNFPYSRCSSVNKEKCEYLHQLPQYGGGQFFIRKFNNDKNVTAEQLRLEESEITSKLKSTSFEIDWQYHVADFYRLCGGQELTFKDTDVVKKNYLDERCFITTRNTPYFNLSPLKLEVVMEKPIQIYIYHDVVTQKEINTIKTQANLQLNRSGLFMGYGTDSTYSFERTQSNTWLEDYHYKDVYRLSKRLSKITDLKIISPLVESLEDKLPAPFHEQIPFVESEPLQVGVYAPGGLYLAHYDAFEEHMMQAYQFLPNPKDTTKTEEVWIGNRMATAMFYFSNVDGGGTVFPIVGRIAWPTKGSVVFWDNLNDDGTRNKYTLHGGCPTLYGIKYVGNKWIREGAQVFKRPCHERSKKNKKV